MNMGPESDPLRDSPSYTMVRSLGKGSFGEVVLARRTDSGEQVAIKCLKRAKVTKYVEGEIVNHSLLRHPFVVEFNEVFLTPECICVSMEFANGGNLLSWLTSAGGKLSELESRWFFQQLVIGVDYCHQRGIVNRDIKLDNTMLKHVNGSPLPLVRICDFGYSKADSKSAPKSVVGTTTYMAPEVLFNSKGKSYDGKASDIWSCGVILYTMLFGKYPFSVPHGETSAKAILTLVAGMVTQRNLFPEDITISPEVKDLLCKMFTPDPTRRIKLDMIQNHPWFLTSLPDGANTITSRSLAKPYPSGHQTPADISRVLGGAALQPTANPLVSAQNKAGSSGPSTSTT